ncbi:MAG: hypothetical protein JNM84_03410 [Planctomycetes bacterium]|nr:hypothetical protein [Planctomycetota bacterium]
MQHEKGSPILLDMPSLALATFALALFAQEPAEDPVTAAWRAFQSLDEAPRHAVLVAIEARLRADTDPELQRLLALVVRARAELAIAPAPEPAFHDPATYAPGPFRRGEIERAFAPAESDANPYYEQRFAVAATWPPFPLAVGYDFGKNRGIRWRAALPDADQLWLLLGGHLAETDLLHAFLCAQLDFAAEHDAAAEHFRHAYCDLSGTAYRGVQLYHAFASTQPIDMPDVDVIAFARNVAKDRSFTSPIPANAKREKLYEAIRRHFLAYYQHRTWIEAAATIYLDPEARLREEHEGLRARLLFAFAEHHGDPTKLRASFARAKTRDAWIEGIDRALEPPGTRAICTAQRDLRVARRARIGEHTREVLREHRLLREPEHKRGGGTPEEAR